MKFTDSEKNGVVVFHISGKVMGGQQQTRFHGRVHEYINQNRKSIVIDLKGVEWMNSTGIGMLISAFTTVSRAGGKLALSNITNIKSLLTITRLITVLPNHDSLDEAVASVKSEVAAG